MAPRDPEQRAEAEGEAASDKGNASGRRASARRPETAEELEAYFRRYEQRAMRRTVWTVVALVLAGAALLAVVGWKVRSAQRDLEALDAQRLRAAAQLDHVDEELNQRREEVARITARLTALQAAVTVLEGDREPDAGGGSGGGARYRTETLLADLRQDTADAQAALAQLAHDVHVQRREPMKAAPERAGRSAAASDGDQVAAAQAKPSPAGVTAAPERPIRVADEALLESARARPQVHALLQTMIRLRDGGGASPARLATRTAPARGAYTAVGFVGEVYRQLPRAGGMRLMSDRVQPDDAVASLFHDEAPPHPGDALLPPDGSGAELYTEATLDGARTRIALGLTERGVVARRVEGMPRGWRTAHAGLSAECLEHLLEPRPAPRRPGSTR